MAACRVVNLPSSQPHGVAPSAWRRAAITPVPKCMPINGLSDLRPISVTPILSRMVERLVVKDHIFPAIPGEQLFDQYGFKRTGSTTAALVDITSTVSIMLEDNKYVRCLLIDFLLTARLYRDRVLVRRCLSFLFVTSDQYRSLIV